MTMDRKKTNQTSAQRRVDPPSQWRMIGVDDLPTVTKAEFIRLVGDRGVPLRPHNVKYVRYIDRQFWFILLGSEDEDTTEPGCASSWKVVTDDGTMSRWFEIYDDVPIYRTPLKHVVPVGSKLRRKRRSA